MAPIQALLLGGLHAGLMLCAASAPAGGDPLAAVQGRVHVHHYADSRHALSSAMSGDQCKDLSTQAEEEAVDAALAARAEVVVVRGTGEDVRWLDALHEIPAVVYNRNGLPEMLPKPRANLRVVQQANTGREDDAILRHIINNYDKLAEVTIFLQGWPFWHCAGTMEMIRRALRNTHAPMDPDFVANGARDGLVPLASSFYLYDVPEAWLGSWANLMQGEKKPYHMKYEEAEELAKSSYNETCNNVLNGPCPQQHWVSEGSQWAVSRERIRSQPVSFYQRLLDLTPAGREDPKKRLRGLVLEALWPHIWGVPGWTPGNAIQSSRPGKFTSSLKRTDALGNYCIFGTDKGALPSAGERRGVCELEQHAAGLQAGVPTTPWAASAELRPVLSFAITREAVQRGAKVAKQPEKPRKKHLTTDPAPFCSKRHIWNVALVTHIRNKESGKCVAKVEHGFDVSDCEDEAEEQQWELVGHANGGYYQLQDKNETSCVAHDWTSSKSHKCHLGPDGGAVEEQKWELLKQGDGDYQIKVKDASECMVHSASGGFKTGACEGRAASWQLVDAVGMGQYTKRFDFSFTAMPDGKLKLRCATRLHSDDAEAAVDLVQPEWRKKGRLVTWSITDAAPGSGAYVFSQRGAGSSERYLGCDAVTGDAVLVESKVAWKIHPVSEGFVFLESNHGVLQFIAEGGFLRCSPNGEDGVPPQDTAFALDFLQPVQNV